MLASRGLVSVESALPGEHRPRGGFCQLVAEEESVSEIIVDGGVEQRGRPVGNIEIGTK